MTSAIELAPSATDVNILPSATTGQIAAGTTLAGQSSSNSNLAKLENFFQNSAYRETIECIANFNTRLSYERRQRLPFRDQQTGIGQKHSQLYVDRRYRMPGHRQGQVYTYPAPRWRKSRRQYLYQTERDSDTISLSLSTSTLLHQTSSISSFDTPRSTLNTSDLGFNSMSCPSYNVFCNGFKDSGFNGQLLDESSNGANVHDNGKITVDSKENHNQHSSKQQQQKQLKSISSGSSSKDNLSKDWYYLNDLSMNDSDPYDELKSSLDDDEFDYDPRYGVKKRRKRKTNNSSNNHNNNSHSKGNSGGKKGSGSKASKKSSDSDTSKKRTKTGQGRGRPSNSTNNTSDKSGSSGSRKMTQDEAPYQPAGMMLATTEPPIDDDNGKRPRAAGTRGRRRVKNATNNGSGGTNHLMTTNQAMGLIPLHHALQHNQRHHQQYHSEPPSFDSVAAAVGSVNDC